MKQLIFIIDRIIPSKSIEKLISTRLHFSFFFVALEHSLAGLRWINDGMAIGWSQARPRNVRTEGVHYPVRHVDASRSAPDGSFIEKNVSRC